MLVFSYVGVELENVLMVKFKRDLDIKLPEMKKLQVSDLAKAVRC